MLFLSQLFPTLGKEPSKGQGRLLCELPAQEPQAGSATSCLMGSW